MKIYIASDHAGFKLKNELIEFIKNLDFRHEVSDLGPSTLCDGDDYPDTVLPVAESVAKDPGSIGFALGGSGLGEAMVCNKVKGIRAAVFYGEHTPIQYTDMTLRVSKDPYEVVKLSREHNDANILSIGARFVSSVEAKMAAKLFIETKFSGEERHVRRIKKISDIEKK